MVRNNNFLLILQNIVLADVRYSYPSEITFTKKPLRPHIDLFLKGLYLLFEPIYFTNRDLLYLVKDL